MNTSSISFQAGIGTQNIASGGYIGPARAYAPLNNTNAVTQVQLQYSGIDSFWRLLPGNIEVNIPNANSPTYQIESFSYFSGGNIIVDTYISNQTGSTITIPNITIYCRGFVFNAPF
jgi:hypothetical protein